MARLPPGGKSRAGSPRRCGSDSSRRRSTLGVVSTPTANGAVLVDGFAGGPGQALEVWAHADGTVTVLVADRDGEASARLSPATIARVAAALTADPAGVPTPRAPADPRS